MKKPIIFILIFISSFYLGYSQEQAPSIEWAESYNGGTRGGSITTFHGPNVLFALIKGQNTNSGTASISKFYADGLSKEQFIQAEGGSSNVPVISQYASQDGGVLVSLLMTRLLRKYDASLNPIWEKSISYNIQNATATLANGFYLLSTSTLNNKTASDIKRMKSDGSIEWTVDITSFWSATSDIQTTSDDGIIITTSNGIRKYSSSGQQIWSNAIILDGYQLTPIDPSSMYVQTYNATTNIRKVIQINTLFGNANWTKTFSGEVIYDFERTSDNGSVVSTNTGLYKYNSTGTLEWKNTNYSSSKIATTGDGKIFTIKNNSIIKLSFTNELIWSKSFNSDYFIIQDINSASDFGLYVTVMKNGIYYNTAPTFFLFKLASPNTPCKSNIDIIGEPVAACKTGSLPLSSKIGNSLMENLIYLTDFSFQWNKDGHAIQSANNYSYTGTQSGNYSLTIKQQGCETTSRNVALNIANENPPIIVADNEQICAGNSVLLTATGCDGTAVWSTGERGPQIKVIPQATTSYTALCEREFNNELCQSITSDNFTVQVLSASNLKINDIVGKRQFCENNSTELKPNVSGGTLPLLYIWTKDSNGFSQNTNLTINEEGKYVLSVFDKVGCVVRSDTLLVKKLASPTPPTIISEGGNELCNNGKIILTADLNQGFYQWILDNTEITGATNQFYSATAAGKYRLSVSNTNGCSSISNNTITITQLIIPQPTIKQSNDSLISSALVGNKWYLNGNELPFTAQKIKFIEIGNYQVKVFQGSCESSPSLAFLPVLLANEPEIHYLQLYPNPTSDKVFLKSTKPFTYQLIDVKGNLISKSNIKSFNHTIDLINFPTGNYFVIFQEESGNKFLKKLSINR